MHKSAVSLLRNCLKIPATLGGVIILIFASIIPATAQSSAGITLSNPDVRQYPTIQSTFRAVDKEGNFVKNIQLGELQILENNRFVEPDNLELVQQGVRFIVAINEGPTLANRYATGGSRFDKIKDSLLAWTRSQDQDSPDRFAIVTNQGQLKIDPTKPSGWTTTLQEYAPDLRNATPDMASLSTAVDIALAGGADARKPAVILFITPLPSLAQSIGLTDIINRAATNNVRVCIWLIGPPDFAVADGALLLQEYADQTGGAYFLFSGLEELPPVTNYLDPLSYHYEFSYTTAINTSGSYNLSLKVQRDDLYLESEQAIFNLTILEPQPIFLSPPAVVNRSWTETSNPRDAVLTPETAPIRILIEFPDGIKRDLAYSRLFVDGKLEDENTIAPFEGFTWSISGYAATGTHRLQATIEDAVGLKGETIELPVEVIIAEPPRTMLQKFFSRINLVNGTIGGSIFLLLFVGIVALIRFLKKRPRKPRKPADTDPLTQPVEIAGEYTLTPHKPEEKVEWPVIHGVGLAPARLLLKRNVDVTGNPPGEIPLSGVEICVGSERKKVDFLLVHPTVSPLHARLFRDTDGNFRVADAGSNAGTWVNYAPVSSHGAHLEHGDLVQFGQVAYTFELHGATPRRVVVLPYNAE